MAEYPNRSDLRTAPTATARFTGQTYGQASQQAQSQQMVRPGSSPVTQQAEMMAASQGRAPGSLGPLIRPTDRPDEVITAGANFGPGPNMAQAGMPRRILADDTTKDKLLALYDLYPSDRLRMLISRLIGES